MFVYSLNIYERFDVKKKSLAPGRGGGNFSILEKADNGKREHPVAATCTAELRPSKKSLHCVNT
jgi:hypothetical protein